MSSQISIDVSLCHAKQIGQEHGFTDEEFSQIAKQVECEHQKILEDRKAKKYGFYDLYKDTDTRNKIREVANHLLSSVEIENVVILGIGGSALGIIALNTALNPPYYNLLSREQRHNRPKLFVMDNIDPDTFQAMLELCPIEKTVFNAISKSGETAETMCQLMIILDLLEKKLGTEKVKDHLVLTTSPKVPNGPKSLMHPIAEKYNCTVLEIPLNVGGRFSVFTPVGLFPAELLGMDIEELAEGCAEMDKLCSQPHLADNPAYLFAGIHYWLDRHKGKHISVMMPYSDRLKDVADWYRQLWAESLGKRYSINGEEVWVGQTPIKALGVTDQHSQIQLYREGPNDKIINMIKVGKYNQQLKIPVILEEIPELEYLRGQSMNDLMHAEYIGTRDALTKSQRPVIEIKLTEVTPFSVAQLLYMLEVATAMAGKLYNVNAFDQPGVEEGKKIARQLMLERKKANS